MVLATHIHTVVTVTHKVTSGDVGWIESHPALASWAQALFTALAVVLAAWLADRSAHKREVADQKRRLDAIEGLMTAAIATIWKAREIVVRWPVRLGPTTPINNDPVFGNMPDKGAFEQLVQALEGVPLHELPSWELALSLLVVRRSAQAAIQNIPIMAGKVVSGMAVSDPFAEQIENSTQALEMFKAEKAKVLSRYPKKSGVSPLQQHNVGEDSSSATP